ncbi:MAG: VWA domain-containing protein [Candidatus Hydrogenedentes bacterium]|nr:VWA domain-containing protein [Candidatus Hydrogenedentota bacterium]
MPLFLLFALSAFALPDIVTPVALDVSPATPVVLADAPQTVYLMVALRANPAPANVPRPPVNIALVLDRSASMAGSKLEMALAAASRAIDRLRPEDTVSVVAYGTTVHVLIPATRAAEKARIAEALGTVEPEGETALFAGLSKAAAEIRKFFLRGGINRIVLLSDGRANVGPGGVETLEQLARSLQREGITISTIGLGLDFQEDSMIALARSGLGNHFFAESPEALPAVFAQEFGEALDAVATGASLRIRGKEGVGLIRILGRNNVARDNAIRIELGDLHPEAERYIIAELRVPSGKAGDRRVIADVDAAYTDVANGERQIISTYYPVIEYGSDPATIEQRTDAATMAAVMRQLGAERNRQAMELVDKGEAQQAVPQLLENAAQLAEEAKRLNAPLLEQDSASNLMDAQSIEQGEFPTRRKMMQENQLVIQQQTLPSPKAATEAAQ